MKQHLIINVVLTALLCGAVSCKTDVTNAGESSLREEDRIYVKADTFPMQSALGACAAMSVAPDSFLIGECDTHFGTLQADILTQLACPIGFEYPSSATAEVDSICLFMYYNAWYGDGKAPIGLTVYEMDRSTLYYDYRYPSDTVLSSFCSLSESAHITPASRIVIAGEPTDSVYNSATGGYVPYIRIKLSDEFAKRFFSIRDFSSQEAFNEVFKGLYIKSDFGASTILYVTDISMAVYYHFTYPQAYTGKDTVLTDVKAFYANSEVRQVNRYLYPNREEIINRLGQVKDTNFIVAPANIYTRLSVNMDSVFNRIEQQLGDPEGYRVYVNRANLTIDVLYNGESSDRPRDNWDTPAGYMLLIREDLLDTFFAKNELPNDTTAILGTLTAKTDSLANVSYSYSYDLSGLLTNQLQAPQHKRQIDFLLVPVSVTTTTSSSSTTTITAVRQMQSISATYIRSANNSAEPMDIEMVYSGFNKTRR